MQRACVICKFALCDVICWSAEVVNVTPLSRDVREKFDEGDQGCLFHICTAD